MCRFIYFAFVLFLLKNVSGSKRNSHAYLQNLRRVDKFQTSATCAPKEVIVHLSEVTFEKKLLSNEKISPSSTVLHRCQSCIGCHKYPDHSCTPKSQEEVELTFFVTSVKGSYIDYRIGKAVNHTSCWCQPNTSQPK